MTDEDIDIDTQEEETSSPSKMSLMETWENNPMLKMAAIVLTIVVIAGGIFIFSSGEEDAKKAVVRVSETENVKQTPGQKELDPAYRKALEETNKRAAEQAAAAGTSALPVPIGTAKTGGLDMSMTAKQKVDPLAEWRKATEMRRKTITKKQSDEEGPPPPPESVPMAQPIRPREIYKPDPGLAKALADQMRVIVTAQGPPKPVVMGITKEDSEYKKQKDQEMIDREKNATADGGGVSAGSSSVSDKTASTETDKKEKEKVRKIAMAGSIAYGQLINELNSDIQGPVLVQMLSGPFAGGRAIGKIEVKDEYMILTFTTMIKDTVSYAVNAVALNEKTTLEGIATDVDHHYFDRIVLPAASKFIQGYSSAVAQTATTTTQTAGGGQATSTAPPSPKQSIYKGMEESAKIISDMMAKGATRPITVKIGKGTTMGIFFIDTVTTKDAEK